MWPRIPGLPSSISARRETSSANRARSMASSASAGARGRLLGAPGARGHALEDRERRPQPRAGPRGARDARRRVEEKEREVLQRLAAQRRLLRGEARAEARARARRAELARARGDDAVEELATVKADARARVVAERKAVVQQELEVGALAVAVEDLLARGARVLRDEPPRLLGALEPHARAAAVVEQLEQRQQRAPLAALRDERLRGPSRKTSSSSANARARTCANARRKRARRRRLADRGGAAAHAACSRAAYSRVASAQRA